MGVVVNKGLRIMLKEKLIKYLEENPESLKMPVFLEKRGCRTIGCLAGNILLSEDIKLKSNKYGELSVDDPDLVSKASGWIAKERQEYLISSCQHQDAVIPGVARYLWAQEYGDEAAETLPFYSGQWEDVVGWEGVASDYDANERFNNLTAQEVVGFLKTMGQNG